MLPYLVLLDNSSYQLLCSHQLLCRSLAKQLSCTGGLRSKQILDFLPAIGLRLIQNTGDIVFIHHYRDHKRGHLFRSSCPHKSVLETALSSLSSFRVSQKLTYKLQKSLGVSQKHLQQPQYITAYIMNQILSKSWAFLTDFCMLRNYPSELDNNKQKQENILDVHKYIVSF